jgi:hypothetical protein
MTPTVTAFTPTYGKAAHLAAALDGAGAGLIPGGQGFSEARQDTLFASDRCELMRSFGNGPLGGRACSDGYGAIPIAAIPPFAFGAGTFSKHIAKNATKGMARNPALRPDIQVSGGRGGGRVKSLDGLPPDSLVRGQGGRGFLTDSDGRVIADITVDRVKPVVPGQGFGAKRAPTDTELDWIEELWS